MPTDISDCGIPAVFTIPELIDTFLGFLQDDKQGLRNSSLVCKLWATGAARHLFVNLKLSLWKLQALRPPAIHPELGELPPKYWALKTCPRVTHNVRHLLMVLLPVEDALRDKIWVEDITVDVLADVISILPRLQTATLDIDFKSGRNAQSFPSPGPLKLDQLTILPNRFDSISQVLPDIVGLFAEVATLMVNYWVPGNKSFIYHGGDDSARTPSTRVHSLVLRSDSDGSSEAVPNVCKMLVASIDIRRIESLSLKHPCRSSRFNDFIAEHAQNIKEFTLITPGCTVNPFVLLGAVSSPTQHDFANELSFVMDRCTHLHTIRVVLWLTCERSSPDNRERFLLQNHRIWEPTLKALINSSRDLRHIAIGISFASSYSKDRKAVDFHCPLQELNYALFEQIFDRHSSLKTLTIEFPDAIPSFDDARTTVSKQLSPRIRTKIGFSSHEDLELS